MNKQKITLLDLGGVVFQSTGVSNKKIDWKIITHLNHKYGYELCIGEDKFPDFMTEYNALTKQSLTGKEFLKEVFDTLEMNTELVEIVGAQSDIIIVSDNYRENIEYISQRYNFDSWAIKQIYSFDYKMVKADSMFFQKLLNNLPEYTIEDMIFIDDSPHKIESAAKHGIKGIQYHDNEQVKNALKQ